METRAKHLETKEALKIIRQRGGIVRTSDGMRWGIPSRLLYAMLDQGLLEILSRGLFRLSDIPPLSDPDLVTVSLRAPKGVVCLVSALAFHGITTRIPNEIEIALARGAEPPRIAYPPVKTYWFSGEAYSAGVETHSIDGVFVRIYTVEKTLADCFKYRNKLGMETAMEALRLYRERKKVDVEALMRYAKICRVAKVMHPYLEAIL